MCIVYYHFSRSETQSMDFNIPGESKCFYCQKSYGSVMDRILHEECSHLTKLISCSQGCEQTFSDENVAYDHVIKNHDFSQFNCFREPTEPYQCHNCSLVFQEELSYWIHYYRRHPKYSKEHHCSVIIFLILSLNFSRLKN